MKARSPIECPEAIIFDWDNTLVSSWETIQEALNHTLVTMGAAPWSMEQVRIEVRESLRNAFPRLFGERWEQARDLYLGYFETIHLARLQPLPGAEALLTLLQAEGVWLGIVSNKTGRLLRQEIAALGWEGYFGAVVGAGDAAFDKPHPAAIQSVLGGSTFEPGPTVWFVGDTDIDIIGALNAGCRPVLLHSAIEAAEEIATALSCSAEMHAFCDLTSLAEAYRSAQSCKMGAQ